MTSVLPEYNFFFKILKRQQTYLICISRLSSGYQFANTHNLTWALFPTWALTSSWAFASLVEAPGRHFIVWMQPDEPLPPLQGPLGYSSFSCCYQER